MSQTYAILRQPAESLAVGERTFIDPQPIEFDLAVRQHQAYEAALVVLGVTVETLPPLGEYPDSVFVEDTAVVLDEVAVLGCMGAKSRRPEVEAIRPVLSRFRELVEVSLPGTLEGGDVLVVDRQILVGISARTNLGGIQAFTDHVRPYGYQVVGVPVRGCLHLKTACTVLPDQRLLVNFAWLDRAALGDFDCLEVPSGEPWAACQLTVGEQILLEAGHPQTIERLCAAGFQVLPLDLSEFTKAEAGPTCLSLLLTTTS